MYGFFTEYIFIYSFHSLLVRTQYSYCMRAIMKQYIHSIGVALPQRIVSNNDLALHMDTTDEWIQTRTGIHQRRMT